MGFLAALVEYFAGDELEAFFDGGEEGGVLFVGVFGARLGGEEEREACLFPGLEDGGAEALGGGIEVELFLAGGVEGGLAGEVELSVLAVAGLAGEGEEAGNLLVCEAGCFFGEGAVFFGFGEGFEGF